MSCLYAQNILPIILMVFCVCDRWDIGHSALQFTVIYLFHTLKNGIPSLASSI